MQVYNVDLAAAKARGQDITDPRVQEEVLSKSLLKQGGKGAAQETKDLTAFANAKKIDEQIGDKGVLTEGLKRLKLQSVPKDPQKLAKYNKDIEDLEDKIAQRELVLERRFLNRQKSSSEIPVINVDNLAPKK
jgi:hypothetical protein